MNVAYARRNIASISFRYASSKLLNQAARLSTLLRQRGTVDRVSRICVVLPERSGPEVAGRVQYCLDWYLGNDPGDLVEDLSVTLAGPTPPPPEPWSTPAFYGSAPKKVLRVREYIERKAVRVRDYDLVLLASATDLLDPRFACQADRAIPIDPGFYKSREFGGYRIAYEGAINPEREQHISARSRENMALLLERTSGAKAAYAVGTGPSVDELYDHDFDGVATIACNSIVRNRKLMDHMRPAAVCFLDPVFHLGPSRYAEAFRADLVNAALGYGSFLVTSEGAAGLLVRQLPELEPYVIGVELVSASPVFPKPQDLRTKSTPNILTALVVPIASSVSSNVRIGGCDGRKPNENYFWRHNTSVQYDDLMKLAFDAHPAFFRDRLYDRYYKQHCSELESLLRFGESRGIRYQAVSSSYIPALVSRYEA